MVYCLITAICADDKRATYLRNADRVGDGREYGVQLVVTAGHTRV